MEWLKIVELLLPILLKVIEDCPEERAVRMMRRGGFFARMRINSALQECLPDLTDAALSRLGELSEAELTDLYAAAVAAKAERSAGPPPSET